MKRTINIDKLNKAFQAIESHDLKIPTFLDKDDNFYFGVICPDSVWEDLKNWGKHK